MLTYDFKMFPLCSLGVAGVHRTSAKGSVAQCRFSELASLLQRCQYGSHWRHWAWKLPVRQQSPQAAMQPIQCYTMRLINWNKIMYFLEFIYALQLPALPSLSWAWAEGSGELSVLVNFHDKTALDAEPRPGTTLQIWQPNSAISASSATLISTRNRQNFAKNSLRKKFDIL